MYETQPNSPTPATSDHVESGTADRERNDALYAAIERTPRAAEAPRIWVSTEQDYLARTTRGRWIAAARPFAAVDREIQTVLDDSPYRRAHNVVPQWRAFAAEGFGRYQPRADAPLHDIVERANRASEEASAYAAWTRIPAVTAEHCLRFDAAYQGRFDSVHDYVTLLVEQASYDRLLDEKLPASLRPFVEINIDAMAHDLQASGALIAKTNPNWRGVFIFAPRIPRNALPKSMREIDVE